MNVFQKVTLQSLKKNKTRTIVTIIGIILSAAMICGVTTFTSSIQNFARENAIYQSGSWHGRQTDAEFSLYQSLRSRKEIEKIGFLQHLGYAPLDGCANEFKPYLYVLGASEEAQALLPIHITSGRYPASQEEILLPEHLEQNGGIQHQLGDTLTLDLGSRILDGFSMSQNNPCYETVDGESVPNGEVLQLRETRTYQVVGFYSRPDFENYSAPGYTCITIADKNPSPELLCDVYYTLHNPADIYTFLETHNPSGTDNSNVLRYSGIVKYDSFSATLTSAATIVMGLIMFGSVSLIYNAFSISVSERTKQFGLLSSIGATKKQLRRMVFFEAMTVSAIGIPLGILSGIGGIGVTLMLIGSKFRSLRFPIDMEMSVSGLSIVVAIVVSLVTVLISAWIPSRRAMKVTAVEAIRQNADIKIRPRQVKTSKLICKIFGLPGMLAEKYYKRSKKKYRATIVSLFMSIVLFISATSFTDYLMASVNQGYQHERYDVGFTLSQEDLQKISPNKLMEQVKAIASVTNGAYLRENYVEIQIDKSYLSDKLQQGEDFAFPFRYLDDSTAEMGAFICFIPDAEFEKILKQQGLDANLFSEPEAPLAIAFDKSTIFNHTSGRYETLETLRADDTPFSIVQIQELDGYWYQETDTDENGNPIAVYTENKEPYEKRITLPLEQVSTTTNLRSGATLYDRPFYIPDTPGYPLFLYPISAADSILPQTAEQSGRNRFIFRIISSDHSKSYQEIEALLAQNHLSTNSLANFAEMREDSKNTILIIQVFSIGFIVLISLIAAANVFNTISTNIGLRRREFAMLKSVGMTGGAFNRMMNFECLLYGTKALLLGLPVSVLMSILIYKSMSGSFALRYHLPGKAMLLAACSVFVVVFITMLYAMGKIKKDNPIDALKNENL